MRRLWFYIFEREYICVYMYIYNFIKLNYNSSPILTLVILKWEILCYYHLLYYTYEALRCVFQDRSKWGDMSSWHVILDPAYIAFLFPWQFWICYGGVCNSTSNCRGLFLVIEWWIPIPILEQRHVFLTSFLIFFWPSRV